ncbi:MAG: UDP-N-acetylmuramate dehydrogenase, partial [Anaerolineaceae bacterium]|nr:UDP-N-acetylmuramate dehydrogenase [Anaerolineaceae bacterium]
FETLEDQPVVNAESGATLITIVREAAQKGYDDLVWASTIPGTLGGAVYGNAGAHGAEMSCNLVMAEILHREKGMLSMNAEQMQYAYRSSILKRSPGSAVILSAVLSLRPGDPQEIKAAIQANADKRRLTQPSGSSYGSTFKNPAGDSAGRLIEAAGLKGTRIGGVEISTLHANFMINDGTGCAQDYRTLMLMAQKAVFEKFGVKLELEIELIGKWQD